MKENEESYHEGYMKGYDVLETLSSGIHVVRRIWGLGINRPVIAADDSHKFVSMLVPELGFKEVFENIGDVLGQVKTGKYEGVPYRVFVTAPYPFHGVVDRMTSGQKRITLAVEFPLEESFGATGYETLNDVLLGFKMKSGDWKILDNRKNRQNGEYKKMKKAWRKSFENK